MEYIYLCPKCKTIYRNKTDAPNTCSTCNVQTASLGYNDQQWYALSRSERDGIKAAYTTKVQQQRQELEQKKADYARSFNEFYEYDVVTLINKDHGRIDKDRMKAVLAEHAKDGWKLHTIYSNELGKNAVSLLGFGTNSTACEDVLIFERRVESL